MQCISGVGHTLTQENDRFEHWALTLSIPLGKGLSLNLELSWLPEFPRDAPVSILHSAGVAGTWPSLAFHSIWGVHSEHSLTHGTISSVFN